MGASSEGSTFIVHGTHITENLEHHKASDVQRVLEEKGFEKEAGDGSDSRVFHFRQSGQADGNKRTRIVFDAQDFVQEGDGVQLEG